MGTVPITTGPIATNLQWMVGLQFFAIAIFFGFVIVLVVMGMGAWKGIQDLRGRRIQPLIGEGKTMAKNGAAFAKNMASRGKAIYSVAMETADSVGLRAQTTANVVKGTVPEARRMPAEINAATGELRTSLSTAKKVRATLQTVQGVRAASRIAESLGSIVKSAREAAHSHREGNLPEAKLNTSESTSEAAESKPDAENKEASEPAAAGSRH